eukprot:6925280-Pyramimonas_sp.AAC.2
MAPSFETHAGLRYTPVQQPLRVIETPLTPHRSPMAACTSFQQHRSTIVIHLLPCSSLLDGVVGGARSVKNCFSLECKLLRGSCCFGVGGGAFFQR